MQLKSKLVVLFIAFIYLLVVFNENKWRQQRVLDWDKSGYYLYLPATFIYHDLCNLAFYPKMDEKYVFSNHYPWYGIYEQHNTHHRLDKYAIGISVLQLPFFLVSHFITIITHHYPADGYSPYYLLGIIFSTICYVFMGLLLLRNLLLRYFSDNIVAIVILLIGLGTNLYYYTAFEPGMSHPYSFFLFAAAVNWTDLFYRTNKRVYGVIVGLCMGLIIIARPTNILLIIALLCWGLKNKSDLKERFAFIRRNYITILISIFCSFLVIMIQLSYWKYITDHWVYFSYQEEGFNFLKPEIWKGLFSYRKGWFVYTPVAFIAMIGFIQSLKKYKVMTIGLLIFFITNIYVIFSWYQWYYGGGFGSRPMIDSLPVTAFLLACFLQFTASKKRFIKSTIYLILLSFLTLNIFQTYQYSLGVIPWDHNNSTYYWRTFGKLHYAEDDSKLINWNE